MMNEPLGEGEGMEALLQQLAGEMGGGARGRASAGGLRGFWRPLRWPGHAAGLLAAAALPRDPASGLLPPPPIPACLTPAPPPWPWPRPAADEPMGVEIELTEEEMQAIQRYAAEAGCMPRQQGCCAVGAALHCSLG